MSDSKFLINLSSDKDWITMKPEEILKNYIN